MALIAPRCPDELIEALIVAGAPEADPDGKSRTMDYARSLLDSGALHRRLVERFARRRSEQEAAALDSACAAGRAGSKPAPL